MSHLVGGARDLSNEESATDLSREGVLTFINEQELVKIQAVELAASASSAVVHLGDHHMLVEE